jgi:hypothetical protein
MPPHAAVPSHPRHAEVDRLLADAHDAFLAAVARIPAADRDRRPEPDLWSCAEVAEHLLVVERARGGSMLRALEQARADGRLSQDGDTTSVAGTLPAAERLLDRTRRIDAPAFVLPKGELTAAEAVAHLTAARDLTRSLLREFDGADFAAHRSPHPILGELDFYQWLVFLAVHQQRHVAQVGDIAVRLAV